MIRITAEHNIHPLNSHLEMRNAKKGWIILFDHVLNASNLMHVYTSDENIAKCSITWHQLYNKYCNFVDHFAAGIRLISMSWNFNFCEVSSILFSALFSFSSVLWSYVILKSYFWAFVCLYVYILIHVDMSMALLYTWASFFQRFKTFAFFMKEL